MNDEMKLVPDPLIDVQAALDRTIQNKEKTAFAHVMSTGSYTLERTPEQFAEVMKFAFESQKEQIEGGLETRLANAYAFSRMFDMDVVSAYENEPDIIKSLYPGQEISSETMKGRLRMVYDSKKAEGIINMLNYQQLSGDTSDSIEESITRTRQMAPLTNRLEEISQMLLDPDIGNKVFMAFGAVPYAIAGQLPRWIEAGKVGAAAAGFFGLGGLAVGGPGLGLAAGAKGMLLGAGLYGYALEAGAMWGDIKQQYKELGIEPDMELVRGTITTASAIINSIDMLAFGTIAKRAFAAPAKKLALKVTKNAIGKILFSHVMKTATLAMVEEGVTEGVQELVGNLAQSWISAQSEAVGDEVFIAPPTWQQMKNDSLLALALAGPMAFFLGGVPAVFTSVRSNIRNKVAVKNAKVLTNVIEKQAELSAETTSLREQTADVDIGPGEMTGLDPDTDLQPAMANLPTEDNRIRAHRIKRTRTANIGGPATLYGGPGVVSGQDTIMGTGLDENGSTVIYVKKGGEGPMVAFLPAAAAEYLNVPQQTVTKKAKAAGRAALDQADVGMKINSRRTPIETVNALVHLRTANKMNNANLMFLREQGGGYVATSNRGSALELFNNGAEIIGRTNADGVFELSNDVKTVEALGWTDVFEIKTEWDVPAGTKVRKQGKIGDAAGYFYYEKADQMPAEPISPEQVDVDFAEEAEIEAVISEEQAPDAVIAEESKASGVGEEQASLADDALVKATGAKIYGKRPRGWKVHKRIDFAGQKITSIEDIASLFSLLRSPFIEQSHIVFVKDGKIVANNSVSAGLASTTPWLAGKSNHKLQRVLRQIKRLGADEVYFVHNHPNGKPVPSSADNNAMARSSRLIPGYAGDIILNHNEFTYTAPGEATKAIAYDPQVKYEEGIRFTDSIDYIRAIAEHSTERGTALMIMFDEEIRAVLTPTKQYDTQTLYQLMKHFGGETITVATVEDADFKYYSELSQVDDKYSAIGLVAITDKETGVIKEGGAITGDATWQKQLREKRSGESWLWSDPHLEPLLNNETTDPAGPVPNTVKKWRTFWHNLIKVYHITRPQGLSIIGGGSTKLNIKTSEGLVGIDAVAGVVEGVSTIELKVRAAKRGSEPYTVRVTVAQGETGIEAAISPDQELTVEQTEFAKKHLNDIAQALYQEGIDYKIADLKITDECREAIEEYSEFRDEWRLAPILEVRKGHTLKEKIGTLARELSIMAEEGLEGTHDYEAIKAILWEMAQNRVELEGMSAYGISKIKYLAAGLARSRLTPGRLKTEIRETIEGQEGFRVRLPLTKKEEFRLAKIKALDPQQIHGDDLELLTYSKLPGIETLNYNQLQELHERLELFDKLRLKATEMTFFGTKMSLEAMIHTSIHDFEKYWPEDVKNISPAEAAKRKSLWMRSNENFKNFFIDRQTQYFRLIEHIAGKHSVVYHALYRNLETASTARLKMHHRLQDMYSEKILSQELDAKVLSKWADEEVVRGGEKLTNNQSLEIYMHSLSPDNWERITTAGMYYTTPSGARMYLSPEVVNFQAIADEMKADTIATGIAAAYRDVYDSLGRAVGEAFEAITGKPFEQVENYYPIKVAREYWDTGETTIGGEDMILSDEHGRRISIAKSFVRDRLAEGTPLELNPQGSSYTFAISMEQETKFVHMELPFFQASKLLYDPDFKAAVVNSRGLGQKYWDLIESGLQDWAGRQIDIKSTWDSVFLFVRRQATRAGLGLNPFSAMKAMVSWFYAMRYVDPRHAAAGLARLASNGKAEIEMLMKFSPVFRDRIISGALPEVNDILKGKAVRWAKEGLPKAGTKDYDTLIFSLIKGVDKRTVAAVMLGAIDQALDAFKDKNMTDEMKVALNFDEAILPNMSAEELHAAAITYAEYVMQRTQPDFRPQSRNQFQRGTSIERLASVFGSFVTITHNMFWDLAHRIRREGIDSVGVKEMAWTLTLMVAVAAGNEGIDAIKKTLLKRDEATATDILMKLVFNNTFIIRDINQMVMSKMKYGEFAGHGGGDAYTKYIDQLVTGIIATTGGLYDGNTDRWMAGVVQMSEGIASFAGAPVVLFGYGTELIDKRIVNK